MHCLKTVVKTNESDNNNAYVVKMSKAVTSSDNETICICKASSVITTSFSITMQIISKLYINNYIIFDRQFRVNMPFSEYPS